MEKEVNQELYTKLYNKALVLLSVSQKSEWELRKKLEFYSKKFAAADSGTESVSIDVDAGKTINSVLSTLTEQQLLNDEEYVSSYIGQKLSGTKKSSRYEIRRFLLRKGLSMDTIEAKLSDMYTDDVERSILSSIVEKRSPNQRTKNKTIKYLVNRGFSYSDVVFCVNEYLTPSSN